MSARAEKVAIVTDSTCDASDAELAEMGVECIHLTVHRADGTEFARDNTPENIEAFYDYLEDCDELPTTSQPTPVEFGDLYSRLALEGYTHIVSLHISSAMSGTVGVARMAAQSAPIPVEVIDTRQLTLSLLLIVRRIAALRDAGRTFAELVEHARSLVGKVSICFMLDTLKNLVKGGRVGKATGVAGSLLDIKPLLTVDDDGEVAMMGIVKSARKAIPKLVACARELAERFGELEVCFAHNRRPEAAAALRDAFDAAGIPYREVGFRQTGPVIATHVHTGCFGFAYIPACD